MTESLDRKVIELANFKIRHLTHEIQSILSAWNHSNIDDFLEDTVEVGQRLKANFESDFAHPQVLVQQKVFGLLDPHTRDVVGEMQPGDLSEHFAEVKRAGVDRPGHLFKRQFLGLMLVNVFTRTGDDGGF